MGKVLQYSLMRQLYADEVSREKFFDYAMENMNAIKYTITCMEGLYMTVHDPHIKINLGKAIDHMNNVKFYLASLSYFVSRNTDKYRDKRKDWFLDRATQPEIYAQHTLGISQIIGTILLNKKFLQHLFKAFEKHIAKKKHWASYAIESTGLAIQSLKKKRFDVI